MSDSLLAVLVEEDGGPAWHEARLASEPQHHQQHEHGEDASLSEGHGAQLLELVLDHLAGFTVLLRNLPSAAKRLLEAAGWEHNPNQS